MRERENLSDIQFDNGIIHIKEKCINVYTHEMYLPFLNKFTNYSYDPLSVTQFEIELESLNSNSTRALLNLFAIAEKLYRRGHSVKVNWHYKSHDNEMLQHGKTLESLVDIPFEFFTLSQHVNA